MGQEATFNFITKAPTVSRARAMERIWCLETWLATVPRVQCVEVLIDKPALQLFELQFDAGNDVPDEVMVRRVRQGNKITVEHLVPPPGVKTLKASWWVCDTGPATVYAHRQIVLKDGQATAAKLRQIQSILKENLACLVGSECGVLVGSEREVA